MDINAAKQVMLRTHLSALRRGVRPNGLHLESGPGIGKSDSVHQTAIELARELNEPVGLVTFMLATISSADVRGFMLPVKGGDGSLGSVFSTPPWFPVLANTSVVDPGTGQVYDPGTWQGEMPRVGMVFLDEFSQAEDEVKKPAAELVYKGAVGTAKLPVGWRVVAAGNRMSDRSGVMRELMFIVNRRCKLSIEATMPAWIEWANNLEPEHRPHYLTLSFAQKSPELVFRDAVPAGSDPFCTPRTLCLMDHDLMALRSDEDIARDRLPMDAIAREVCAGWIGAGEAAQFFTHIKYADELPDIADIERDPMTAKLPAARDAQMVCGYMLAHHCNKKNAPAIMRYINRLNIEMQVLAVRTMTMQPSLAPVICNVVEMTNWLLKNKDLLAASMS